MTDNNIHVHPLPPSPTSPPLFLICSDDGAVSMWRLDWLMQLWSLNVCNEVVSVAISKFCVQLDHLTKDLRSDSDGGDGSLVSHTCSQSLPSHVSYSGSIPFSDSTFGHSPHNTLEPFLIPTIVPSVSTAHFSEGTNYHTPLDSYLIALGTARGRLLILDSVEGRILFDANVMDAPLEFLMMSTIYGDLKDHNEGFVLTCGSDSGVCYSLFLGFCYAQDELVEEGMIMPSEKDSKSLLTPDDLSGLPTPTRFEQVSTLSSSPNLSPVLMYSKVSKCFGAIVGLREFCDGIFEFKEQITSMWYREDELLSHLRICIQGKQNEIYMFSMAGEEDVVGATKLRVQENESQNVVLSTRIESKQQEYNVDSHFFRFEIDSLSDSLCQRSFHVAHLRHPASFLHHSSAAGGDSGVPRG